MATNSTSNKEFSVKTLENQQKVCIAFIRLISTHLWCPWSLCYIKIYQSKLNRGSIIERVHLWIEIFTVLWTNHEVFMD